MFTVIASDHVWEMIQDVNGRFYGHELRRIQQTNPKKTLECITSSMNQYVLIEIAQLSTHPEAVISTILKLKAAMDCTVFVVCYQTELPSIVQYQLMQQVALFLCADHDAALRKQLMDLFLMVQHPSSSQLAQQNPAVLSHNIHTQSKTIAVTGCRDRIGTTTQALQIVKYLQMHHRTACYVEMDDSHTLRRLGDIYDDIQADPDTGTIRYKNMDLYTKPEMMTAIQSKEYEFMVFDYGVFPLDDPKLQASCFERDICVMVAGIKPGEIQGLFALFPYVDQQHVQYIFSFVSPSEQLAVKQAMAGKGTHTYFTGYVPDYFSYQTENEPMHDQILTPFMTRNALRIPPDSKRKAFKLPFGMGIKRRANQ